MDRLGNAAASANGQAPKAPYVESPTPRRWPTVSVIIPLHGGESDFAKCLESLSKVGDLVHELIVVDNASPDGAGTLAEGFIFEASTPGWRRQSSRTREEPGCTDARMRLPKVQVVRNETNRGFAAACNQGISASTGEVVVLLNSDTYVTRAGLIELVESLMAHGTIAVAGPYTNNSAHQQRIDITYTSLETVELFAEDFAARAAQDREVDMLVGFCLAMKRSALEEIGLLDERFGLGTWEDNDLCYRFRREGYRLVISAKSFIHHTGSRTIERMGLDYIRLLSGNRDLYIKKWQRDLDTGFASSLSGLRAQPIEFEAAKKPESILANMRQAVERADISFCMIARDEERCIAECLTSIAPFVTEMIVVDTGSNARTAEIAEQCGANVYVFPWTKSFAEARNESLRHAKGKWIFWADADDVLPIQSGVEIVANALNVPGKIGGLVIPVRFMDDAPTGGVQVDHVKLFRNDPNIRFTHRIHEQVLEGVRRQGYEIARSKAIVLHANYDTSEPGQEKKRNRDRELLALDLRENPGHPFVMFNLGMTAHYLKRYRQAERWLRKSIRGCKSDESHLRKAYDLLALSLIQQGRKGEAEHVLRLGLEKMPDDAEMNFHMAQLLTAKADGMEAALPGPLPLASSPPSGIGTGKADRTELLRQARAHYDKVLKADLTHVFSSVDRGILGYKSLHNRAEVDVRLDNYPAAKEGFLSALKQTPRFLVSAFGLFQIAIAHKDFATAREMLEHVRSHEGFSENWSKMTLKYGEALLDLGFALDILKRAFEVDPSALAPRMEFCRAVLNNGDVSAALPHLMFLQERGVAEAAHFLGMASAQSGQLKPAHNWFKRAQSLNPGQPQTEEALKRLEEALDGAA